MSTDRQWGRYDLVRLKEALSGGPRQSLLGKRKGKVGGKGEYYQNRRKRDRWKNRD